MKRLLFLLLFLASSVLADEKIKSGVTLTLESGATLEIKPGAVVLGIPSLIGTMTGGDIAVFNNSTGQLRAGTSSEVMTFGDDDTTFIPFFDTSVIPHVFSRLFIGTGLAINGATLEVDRPPLLVSQLPAPEDSRLGDIRCVSDGDASIAWGGTVVNSGSGSTKYLVWFNGTNWTVLGK